MVQKVPLPEYSRGASRKRVIPLYEDEQMELDVIEGVDEDGNTVLLQVMEYFYYNGEEYVVLGNAEDCGHEDCDCGNHEHEHGEDCECDHDHEVDLYIMKVVTSTGDDGEEVEEFVPVDEDLMDKLIQVVQTNFCEDDEDEETADDDME